MPLFGQNLKQLTHLNLRANNITFESTNLDDLRNLSCLSKLILSGNNISNEKIQQIRSKCTGLDVYFNEEVCEVDDIQQPNETPAIKSVTDHKSFLRKWLKFSKKHTNPTDNPYLEVYVIIYQRNKGNFDSNPEFSSCFQLGNLVFELTSQGLVEAEPIGLKDNKTFPNSYIMGFKIAKLTSNEGIAKLLTTFATVSMVWNKSRNSSAWCLDMIKELELWKEDLSVNGALCKYLTSICTGEPLALVFTLPVECLDSLDNMLLDKYENYTWGKFLKKKLNGSNSFRDKKYVVVSFADSLELMSFAEFVSSKEWSLIYLVISFPTH